MAKDRHQWRTFVAALHACREHDAADVEKRLLINDPDAMIHRMASMEKAMEVMNATLQRQEQTIQHLSQQLQTAKTGSTYIRWGRKQCPGNQTELVYSGYAGGGGHNGKGSAAEYVCLPPDPDFDNRSGGGGGQMFGGEFHSNLFASNALNQDVPCALCRAPLATSAIMIPGKNTCYSDWKLEYHGYLASGYYGHEAATAYVCIDINPEYIIGGREETYGKLFYGVFAVCGTLKCPPYVDNHPLTCVVCSK